MSQLTSPPPALAARLQAGRFVTVLHYYATGPGQELHTWLAARGVAETLLIEHPFPFSRRDYARVEQILPGQPPREQRRRRRGLPMLVRYGLDLLRTLRLVWATGTVYDYYVGNGSFDALAGIVLRALGRVRRVVVFTIDYAPSAGRRRWYGLLYRLIDRACCRRVDLIWNLCQRIQAARIQDGLPAAQSAPALTVPHGTHALALRDRRPAQPDPCRIGFLGHIQKKSGLQLFVEILPRLRTRYPAMRLEVVGDGPYRPTVEALVRQLHLEDCVTFHGFVADHEEAERILLQCGLGLALYWPEVDDYSRYTDPGKPKVYLACGLPVVIVDVPEVAAEIAARGAGLCVRYDARDLEEAVAKIVADHAAFRARALAMGEDYDWDRVYECAWTETLARI